MSSAFLPGRRRGGFRGRAGYRHRRGIAVRRGVCRGLCRFCLRGFSDQRRPWGNERTILAGVAASQLFNAITAYTISTSASAQQARDVMFWLLGSFSGVRWPEFQLVLVVVVIGLAVCLYYSRALDAFTFGDDAAASLGIAVPWVRLILFTTTALITATIVSMAGSIGFVGLVVPT